MKMMIYGAQGYALGAYEAVKTLYPDSEVLMFTVTSMNGNAPTLGGLPVREIGSVSEELSSDEKKNISVLIATPENVQGEIEETLEEHGFIDHTRLTSDVWDDLMRQLNMKTGRFLPLGGLSTGDIIPKIRIYMARSHKDKTLRNPVALPDYMTPIQVGAANTGDVIADLRDDTGDNISAKNANYCELTGLYRVWKSMYENDVFKDRDNHLYYGFAQYRRVLILSDEDLSRLVKNDIDVVLPYPLMYEPDIHSHHERYLKESDWNALLTALRELQPEYADYFPQVLKQQYLYNYNVILAKKAVLRDYCAWLFPILERTEELSVPKGCERADRYIGYMGETLETLYFIKNANKLNIVHTGCKIFV